MYQKYDLISAGIVILIILAMMFVTSLIKAAIKASSYRIQRLTPNITKYLEYQNKDHVKAVAELLMTLYNDLDDKKSEIIQIYYKKSGEIVLVDHKNKIVSMSPFGFYVQQMNNDNYTYHPAKTVYTGATVGGIHTGGFHTEEAHYTHSYVLSGNGVLFCNYATNLPYFLIARIKLNDHLLNKALLNDDLKKLIQRNNNIMILFNTEIDINAHILLSLRASNKYDAMSLYNQATSKKLYPVEYLSKIARWLNQEVINYRNKV